MGLQITKSLICNNQQTSDEEEEEKCVTRNGRILLQKLISHSQGRSNPISIFTRREIQEATNNYHPSRIIGDRGSHSIYRGILNNRDVIIKYLHLVSDANVNIVIVEGLINEITILASISHKNVTKLLGCCLETRAPILVYEFVCNGSLQHHVRRDNGESMSWPTRLKVAMDIAYGLSYLHYQSPRPIVHRDVKPTNIMLDENFTAKLANFGSSITMPLGTTEVGLGLVGSMGYFDPEYLQTSVITEKIDVHSFGLVLLLLLTGREPHEWGGTEHEFLFDVLQMWLPKEFSCQSECLMEIETEEKLEEYFESLLKDTVLQETKIEPLPATREWCLAKLVASASALKDIEGRTEQLSAFAEPAIIWLRALSWSLIPTPSQN